MVDRKPKTCRHTMLGASLDRCWISGLTGGHVPPGDAAHQPGRLGGVVSAAGAQRAPPADRQPDREGDPQLRPGGERRPGRVGPAGELDLPVPDPRGGDQRRRGRRGRGTRLPPAGRGVDAGQDRPRTSARDPATVPQERPRSASRLSHSVSHLDPLRALEDQPTLRPQTVQQRDNGRHPRTPAPNGPRRSRGRHAVHRQ
jgi:hypothetical protein